MPWFAKENRRAAARHRYDGNDTWVGLDGSLFRQCQILDLSRTGVRLAVTNAESLPNTFTLILSKNGSGRPARVKWRRGNEVGAEFFAANSSSASRLAAGAPTTVKPRGVSESLMSAPSLHAQDQQPDVAKFKTETRKAVGSISGDKAKTEAYCPITDLGGELERAGQQKNNKKRVDFSLLEKKLGPDHVALIDALKDLDPNSPHGQELASIIESLDELP
ncbi:MAG TPA: PilZ domain-containing protein [Terriglobales bacterium]|nr:PilZ domain-containing protein [Terriglobales bacterium]